MRDVFAGFDVDVVDIAVGARPGLDAPLAQEFVAAVGGQAAAEVRLDRRRAVLGDGRSRGQLRPGRPASRAPRRGAGPARADRGRGTRTAGVAEHALIAAAPTRGWKALPGAAADRHPVPRRARRHDACFLILAAALSPAGSRFGPDATIGDFVLGWDAQWYWFIAVNGYPTTLPLTDAGEVAENQWAFMPIYPYLAKIVGLPFELLAWTGAPSWGIGALIVSIVAGYLACLVLYRMLRDADRADRGDVGGAVLRRRPARRALPRRLRRVAVPAVAVPVALAACSAASTRWLYLLIPLMGFTRPGVLAFALFLGLYGISRWVAPPPRAAAGARDRAHRRAGPAGGRSSGSRGR